METSRPRDRFLCFATVTFLLLVSGLLLPQGVGASPSYFDDLGSTNDFVGKYPTWPHTSQPNSCLVCHATFPPTGQLNAYGNAFKAVKTGTAVTSALTAIAGQDSDGDGFKNEFEILFGKFPGNSGDKPSLPGGVNASDGTFTDKVQVSWNAYPNATFELHRADSPDGPKTKIASPSSTQHADTTAVAGKTYHFWVKACNSAGCTDFSTPDAGMKKVAAADPGQQGQSRFTRRQQTPIQQIPIPGPSRRSIKQPDLIVADAQLIFEGKTFATNSTVYIPKPQKGVSPKFGMRILIKNIGQAAAPASIGQIAPIGFVIPSGQGDQDLNGFPVKSLAPGEEVKIIKNLGAGYASGSEFYFNVWIDYQKAVAESNDNNNVKALSYKWYQCSDSTPKGPWCQ